MHINVTLLVEDCNKWMYDLLFACDNKIKLHHRCLEEFDVIDNPNPYFLPPENKSDVLIITSSWAYLMIEKKAEGFQSFLEKLTKQYKLIVGVDGSDTFSLNMPKSVFPYVKYVIKAQGIYKDKEMYNYKMGTEYAGANWTEKKRLKEQLYKVNELDKIVLGPPCFLGIDRVIRKKVRKAKPSINYSKRVLRNFANIIFDKGLPLLSSVISKQEGVFYIGAMTHYQRMIMVEMLKKNNIAGLYGITKVPNYIWGTPGETKKISLEMQNEIIKRLTNNSLLLNKRNRLKYLTDMLAYNISLAPCGYGELSFRMAETWQMKRVLICQNIQHVDTMYPFENNRNVIYTKPDFSDLLEKISELNNTSIGRNVSILGNNDWTSWIQNKELLLERGIVHYLRS